MFVYKVYTVIESLFLRMVLRPTVNPGSMLVLKLGLLPWACLSESTLLTVGVVLPFMTQPCFSFFFCVTLPYHGQAFF